MSVIGRFMVAYPFSLSIQYAPPSGGCGKRYSPSFAGYPAPLFQGVLCMNNYL